MDAFFAFKTSFNKCPLVFELTHTKLFRNTALLMKWGESDVYPMEFKGVIRASFKNLQI